jgi:hypothetical protein
MTKQSTSGTQAILRAALALGTFGLVGCGGGTVVVHEPAPAPLQGPAEEVATEEPAPETETVVVQEGDEPVVVERTIEVEQDPVIQIRIEKEYFGRHPHYQRLNGVAVVNYNTGYLDGWAGADFFNHGQPLNDSQVDRMIETGRRQGDPSGKLSLVGYQEGYRAGAQHERNPYQRRMNVEQAARFRTLTGAAPEGKRENNTTTTTTTARVGSPEAEAARKARLEASKNNLEAARLNREAEQKKLQTARLDKAADRKAELDAAKAKREANELALKQKLETEKKQRETERQQREVALKTKIEADKKAREDKRRQEAVALQQKQAEREAAEKAAKEAREAKKDQRQAALDKRKDDRKQKLAEKKAERDAKNTETADTSDASK